MGPEFRRIGIPSPGIRPPELEDLRRLQSWGRRDAGAARRGALTGPPREGGRGLGEGGLGATPHPQVLQLVLSLTVSTGFPGSSSHRIFPQTSESGGARGHPAMCSIHKDLEAKIARFHQREDAILYPSCFDANAGLFEALLSPQDAVLSDELNHASIIDGIRLCKAHKYRYRHLDMADLEAKLQEAQNHRLRLVATDGAFSVRGWGDRTPVGDLPPCLLIWCPGFCTDELLGVMDQVTIINSTLGKHTRPYLFSNSLSPAVVGCASKALDLLMESNAIVQPMAAKTQRFLRKMEAAGFTVLGAGHPICPVMLGDARLASCMAADMLKRGIFVIGFSYPVVPKNKARIRVQISAVHSEEDIDRCVEAFVEVGRLHGALP
ncbi:unnamed protein product [Nyctereutes procyonoides]|uniref:(raccoon dog) hypothetical protein n=1 Tax=Nyctereutes procyonoides TaxID=34880 RepID=A0A811ZX11_NYCPR|nr:unnamed protein product [Nyctereutes procyonoides]